MKKSEVCEWPMNNGRFNRNSISGLSGIIDQNNESGNLDKYADRLLKNFNRRATTSNDSVTFPTRKYSLLSNSDSTSSCMGSNSSKLLLIVSPSASRIPIQYLQS